MSISDVSCGCEDEVQRSVYEPRGVQNKEGKARPTRFTLLRVRVAFSPHLIET